MAKSIQIDRRAVFSNHVLFRRFDQVEIDRLVKLSRVQRYESNEVIFRKGDPGLGLLAVLTGHVRISSCLMDQRQVIFNIIYPGEIFGEIALLDGKPRTADAVAIRACDLLIIDRREFLPFLERHPEMYERLLTVLCDRLRRTTEQVEDQFLLDLEKRLAKTLIHLCEVEGDEVSGCRILGTHLSQRDLARLIGVSRESVNRQLAVWQHDGIVAVGPTGIVISNLENLRRVFIGD